MPVCYPFRALCSWKKSKVLLHLHVPSAQREPWLLPPAINEQGCFSHPILFQGPDSPLTWSQFSFLTSCSHPSPPHTKLISGLTASPSTVLSASLAVSPLPRLSMVEPLFSIKFMFSSNITVGPMAVQLGSTFPNFPGS